MDASLSPVSQLEPETYLWGADTYDQQAFLTHAYNTLRACLYVSLSFGMDIVWLFEHRYGM